MSRSLVMVAGAALAIVLGACTERAPAKLSVLERALSKPEHAESIARTTELAACRARLARVRATPALPGAPAFEAQRAVLLARAKGEPVLFTRAPQPSPERSGEAQIYARQIEGSPSPGYSLARLYKNLVNRPELARELLLREGYLYAESPSLAAAMVEHVELAHLFSEPRVVIERGGERLLAVRGAKNQYYYESGPEKGAKARVLFLDRLSAEGSDSGPPLHVELRRAQVRAGFDRMRNLRLVPGALSAEVRYGARWVQTLFDVKHGQAHFACEIVPPAAAADVAFARDLARRRQRVLEAKRSAILAQIEEALPFDEPITEDGQQDGNLRPAWTWAYNQGWDSYQFNDDYYTVFDGRGRPRVPQVCIDFITDTLERASGTWWRGRDEQRERLKGRLDFGSLPIENRRSVEVFTRFAREHPEWFDVLDVPPEERVPFIFREQFFDKLLSERDVYLPGDIVVIHGPRDDGEYHYHSFWIYDADPVTGMPTLVASNAGRPRIRTWEFEMRVAPRRWIKARVRPRLGWLEDILVLEKARAESLPAPLASAPI